MKKDGQRYDKVFEQMELLSIKDVSTPRQCKNGTIVWQLPIKNNWPGNKANASFIKVASFSTGYVRNQNSGYSNYQLNKRCKSDPQYYPEYKWCERKNKSIATGKYNMFTTKACVLIPKEIDRLEYLIAYCLKNYYIKHANFVSEGRYVEQWYHEHELEKANRTYSENTGAMARINDMEEKLDTMTDARDYYLDKTNNLQNKLSNAISATKHECTKQYSVKLEEKLYNLQNKLATIERIASDRNKWDKE